MIEVHPPHTSTHTLRDFLVGLLMITIGLLIALSLEGCVGWVHHRHLVHEAEASLRTEIRANARQLDEAAAALKREQDSLKADVSLLNQYIKTHNMPSKTHNMPSGATMEVKISISKFDSLSWATAQSTGAVPYMPYVRAREYSEIYMLQEALDKAQQEAARDAIISMAPFVNMGDNFEMSTADAIAAKQHIEVLQGQLLLVNGLINSLGQTYKKFLAAHAA